MPATFLILPFSFIYDLVIWQLMLALWHRAPGQPFALASVAARRARQSAAATAD